MSELNPISQSLLSTAEDGWYVHPITGTLEVLALSLKWRIEATF